MIEIKFPADRLDIARHLGTALLAIGTGANTETVREVMEADETRRNTGDAQATPAYHEDTEHPDNGGPGYTPDPKQPSSLFDGTAGGTAADADEAETSTTSPAAASTSQAQTDTKGVPFNAEFCGQAAQPFYGSGKRSGQWKKRKGVEDAAYDEWYAGELAKLQASPANRTQAEVGEDDHQPAPVNSAAAFGSAQQAPANAPQNTGEFMGWVSEKQAAGLLTQDRIQAAYAQAGVQVTDLFPPTDAATVAQRISQLYGILSATAGA